MYNSKKDLGLGIYLRQCGNCCGSQRGVQVGDSGQRSRFSLPLPLLGRVLNQIGSDLNLLDLCAGWIWVYWLLGGVVYVILDFLENLFQIFKF